MGNTPSAQHGSPSKHTASGAPGSGGNDHSSPSRQKSSAQQNQQSPSQNNQSGNQAAALTKDNDASSSSGAGGTRNPNLRLPMPSRPTHISPQSSNPTSPSGRSGSPRRRKSLELPDLNKLSFTPAAPVATTATTTSHHLATSTPTGQKRLSDSVLPSSVPIGASSSAGPPTGAGASGTGSMAIPAGRKWQHVLGGRASPLAGANALGAMSKLTSSSVPEPRSAPIRMPNASTSPSRGTDGINPYFPSSPSKSSQQSTSPRRTGPVPIPIPGKAAAGATGGEERGRQGYGLATGTGADGIAPPPPTVAATPPSRAEPDGERQMSHADDGMVNVPLQWVGGGKVVYVTGNFANNWKDRIRLKKSTHDFNTILRLPPGQYRLKFVVDDSWRCSKQIPTATDDDGTLVNWIEVEAPKTEEELKAEWAMDSKPAAKQEDKDDSQWTNVIPAPLVSYQYIEELPQTMEPNDFDTFLRSTPYLSTVPQPPTLPRILDKVIVNAEPKRRSEEIAGGTLSSAGGTNMGAVGAVGIGAGGIGLNNQPAGIDDNSILAVPNHVVLNHLTASAIKNGTLGVGTTTRYRKKYITTMFFKPTLGDLMGDGPQQTPTATAPPVQ